MARDQLRDCSRSRPSHLREQMEERRGSREEFVRTSQEMCATRIAKTMYTGLSVNAHNEDADISVSARQGHRQIDTARL